MGNDGELRKVAMHKDRKLTDADLLRRRELARIVRSFSAGETTDVDYGDVFDEILRGLPAVRRGLFRKKFPRSDDRALQVIDSWVWAWCLSQSGLRVGVEMPIEEKKRAAFERIILFLHTDLLYRSPYSHKPRNWLVKRILNVISLGFLAKPMDDRNYEYWPFCCYEDYEAARKELSA